MTNQTASAAVTLDAFAARVGCHFTTASRLKSGERLPGRALLGRIIEAYRLDAAEALTIYTSPTDAHQLFGEYLRREVFSPDKETASDNQEAA